MLLIPRGYLGLLDTIWAYSLAVVLLIHCYKFRGLYKTLVLFFGGLLVGITVENINALFGGYNYPGTELNGVLLTWFWGKAPFSIGLGWFILMYVSSYFAHGIIGKYKGSLPTIGLGTDPEKGVDFSFLKLTIVRGLLAGAIALSFDLIMDPISVSPELHFWIWEVDNIYIQGVPVSNYLGWFVLISSFSVFHDIFITHFTLKNANKFKTTTFFVIGCVFASAITGGVIGGLSLILGAPGIRTEGLGTHPIDLMLTSARIDALLVAFGLAAILLVCLMLSSLAPDKRPEPRPTKKIWFQIPSIGYVVMWVVVFICAIGTGNPVFIIIVFVQPIFYLAVTIYFLIKPIGYKK